MIDFALESIENIVGKGENAGYQHFLLSHNIFKSSHFQGCSGLEYMAKG